MNPNRLIGNPAEAIEKIDEVLQMIDEIEEDHPDTWDRGESFLEDVREHIGSVKETIESGQRVSLKQATAIENWYNGVCRWHPDHRGR